ncbi:MAG TPA: J domain-containing protein [Flavobacteriales bacterium]|nr:J domain-containing protein [Flavobacteriales bacterium]
MEKSAPPAPTQTPFWFAFSTSSGFDTGSLLVICAIIICSVVAFAIIRRRKKRIQEIEQEEEDDREQKETEKWWHDYYERKQKLEEREENEQARREREEWKQAERREQEEYEQARREREKTRKRRQKGAHYDILGVPEDASQKAIKDAYRKLSLKWHPDKNKSDDANKRFNKIVEAYDVLSDKDKRKKYDAELEQ